MRRSGAPPARLTGGLRLALLLLLIGAAVVLALPLQQALQDRGVEGLRRLLAGYGAWAPIAFTLGAAAAVTLGVPRLLCAAVGGAAFGWLAGGLASLVGASLGSLLAFGLVRWTARDWASRRLGARFTRLDARLCEDGLLAVLMLRLLPLGYAPATNAGLALTSVRAVDFGLGTLLGSLPSTLLVAAAGGAAVGGDQRVLLLAAAGLLLLALSVRRRRGRARGRSVGSCQPVGPSLERPASPG